jgi:uncharacterized protein Usg
MSLAQVRNCRLTTAEITYHLPDFPQLLQTYIWQQPDLAPDFPALYRFLDYWEQNLEGRLHSVKIADAPLLMRREIRFAASLKHLH